LRWPAASKWLLLAWALVAAQADAQPMRFQTGPIEVGDVRSAPTPPVAGVGSVYLWITNHGSKAESLIAVESPVASKVEIHLSSLRQGVMQMREVTMLECPPGSTVKVEPGALHIMLLGLKQPLVAGSTFPLSLKFRDAGMLVVQVSVKPRE
jgi:copper(I)-binding protein